MGDVEEQDPLTGRNVEVPQRGDQQSNSSSSHGSSSPSPSNPAWHPNKPIMGDVELVGTDTYAIWTGGVPKADWSGLVTPKPKVKSSTMYRPSRIDLSQKSRACRIAGLEPKMSKTG